MAPDFAREVRRCRPVLLSKLRAMVGRQDAEDVLQEALAQAWAALPSFSGTAQMSTWLFRAAVTEALNHIAARKFRGRAVTETAPDPDAIDPETPEQIVIAYSVWQRYSRARAALPPKLAGAYEACDERDMTNAEAARHIGIPLPTLQTRLMRAAGIEHGGGGVSVKILTGDSYAGSWGAQSREHAGKHAPNISALSANQAIAAQRKASGTGSIPHGSGLKPKDLIGIPWMVAFALRADGWWLRQDIIWSKPNPMPESVTDRCTKAHEYLFLLSKSERYYYDSEAIAEPLGDSSIARLSQASLEQQAGSNRVPGKTNGAMKAVGRRAPGNKSHKQTEAYDAGDERMRTKSGLVSFAEREREKVAAGDLVGTRNKRSVWTVTTQPFKESHFATFPPALIEPCILAGCPEGGTVLDPFGGAGTSGLVADRLGRNAVLIELNPEYAHMARRRIVGDAPLFAEVV